MLLWIAFVMQVFLAVVLLISLGGDIEKGTTRGICTSLLALAFNCPVSYALWTVLP